MKLSNIVLTLIILSCSVMGVQYRGSIDIKEIRPENDSDFLFKLCTDDDKYSISPNSTIGIIVYLANPMETTYQNVSLAVYSDEFQLLYSPSYFDEIKPDEIKMVNLTIKAPETIEHGTYFFQLELGTSEFPLGTFSRAKILKVRRVWKYENLLLLSVVAIIAVFVVVKTAIVYKVNREYLSKKGLK